MPRSRLLAVAVAGALALPGLAACRDLPAVAAYVGDARITNAQVEAMVNQTVSDFPADPGQTGADRQQQEADRRAQEAGTYRTDIVSLFVGREVARRLAQEHGIGVPAVDAAQLPLIADAMKLSPGSEFVQLYAEAMAAFHAIQGIGPPQAPTEADKQEVFQYLLHAQPPSVTPGQYEGIKSQLDSTEMRAALGLRTVLRDALHKYQVSVNPRYQPFTVLPPVQFTLAGGRVATFVLLSLEPAGPPAVVDRT
jgi:hypothetical protein